MGQLSSNFSQAFPPKPTFTPDNVPNLKGKVYIVTGSNTGVGKELARMLYAKDAKVYIAARSQSKADDAIADIKASAAKSRGALEFLKLDLADLSTIRSTVDTFLAKEDRLHVLFNNAGLQSTTPQTTVQGHEIQMGVNCVGPFLLTKLLTPTLAATARSEPAGAVRVVWVSSSGTEIAGEKDVGVRMDNVDYHIPKGEMYKYGISKTGNYLQGVEYAKRHHVDGIVSVPLNPGNLRSELYRDQPGMFKLATRLLMHPSVMGAYTELYAGFSPDLSLENSGAWVVPWGRIFPIRSDLNNATKSVAEGGNGTAQKFWDWCEEQSKAFN